MYTYDLTVVLDGKLTPAKKKTAVTKIETLITTADGAVGKIKDWGERDLAYPIAKSVSGTYLTFPVSMEGPSAQKFNDKLRLEEGILRYLLIRTGEGEIKEEKKESNTAKGRKKVTKKSNGKKS